MKSFFNLTIIILLFTGCYSARNTAKVRTGVNAAYIAPKGFNLNQSSNHENGKIKDAQSKVNLSSGAYFFDGSMRMGVSNVILKQNDTSQYEVKYLAEEQPDVAREFVKTLTAKANADIKKGSAPAVQAEAQLMTSLTSNIQKLTEKSASLNLSRSILYRLNESYYNGVDEDKIELFKDIANKLIDLQKNEFESTMIVDKKKLFTEFNITLKKLDSLKFNKSEIFKLVQTLTKDHTKPINN
ncbi:hypothetical protein [Aquimarina rhabdastrellae]